MIERMAAQMTPETLSAFPPWLQYVVLAFAGLFVALGITKRYFKEQVAAAVVATPSNSPAHPLLFDSRDIRQLCEVIERLDTTMRNASHEHQRMIDATADNARASENLVRAMRSVTAMPASEEMLVLLRQIARREWPGMISRPE